MVGVLSGRRWCAPAKTAAARELIGRGDRRAASHGAGRAGARSAKHRCAPLAARQRLGDARSRTRPKEQFMTTTPMVAPTFSDEEIVRVLETIKDSDSVELKLTVAESQQRSTLLGLGMDPLDAQIRVVVFFDTPDLTLDQQGVVV